MQHVHPVDPTRRARRRAALVAPVAALALLLAACGSASQDEAAATSVAPQTQDEQQRPEGRGPAGGASGEVAAVDGTTMQVQGDDAQTAVTWTDATTFTQNVDATLADVAPGVCVQVVAAPGEDSEQTAVASAVAISDAVDGTCETGLGGPGGAMPQLPDGERPQGAPDDLPTDLPDGERPQGAPDDLPEGGAPAGGFGGFGTSGLVSAVDGPTLTVEVTSQDGSTSTATVTVDDATTYTRTVAADASAAAVGRCVLVQGEADDSGAVTATSVMVSTPGDDGCSLAGGPGMRGPGGPGGSGGSDGSDGEGGPAPRQADEGTASDDA